MSQIEKIESKEAEKVMAEPAKLAGEYLRSFTQSLAAFSDFDNFLDTLKRLVGEDSYLVGSAELCDPFKDASAIPDFESLDADETVIAVANEVGSSGYLKYSGRADARPFGAEDLHLMSAVAGMVGSLVAEAQNYQQKEQAAQVLQFLINQLPLGVVCFAQDNSLIIENKLAARILGQTGLSLLEGHLKSVRQSKLSKVQLHLEVDGKLVFSEGRSLPVNDRLVIQAFVLYDMSSSKEKLLLELEREAYLSESRGNPLTLVVLESPDEAGGVFRKMKAAAQTIRLPIGHVQALDAHRCACVFRGKHPREVRRLLLQLLGAKSTEGKRGAIVGYTGVDAPEQPAQGLLGQALEQLVTLDELFKPRVLVVDAYSTVVDALELILADSCSLEPSSDIEVVLDAIGAGDVDGLILDVDSCAAEAHERIQRLVQGQGESFHLFYTSVKQPQVVCQKLKLAAGACVLQKPFDASVVADLVSARFNLA
ncbi:MAG: hypothetical protein ACPGJU_04390 [Coraliomargarita sp.]